MATAAAETAPLPPDPAAASPSQAASATRSSTAEPASGDDLLHNLPFLKTWGGQRLLRCAKTSRSRRPSLSPASGNDARHKVADELEAVREKLLVQLRMATDRLKMGLVHPDPDPIQEAEPTAAEKSPAPAPARPWNLRSRSRRAVARSTVEVRPSVGAASAGAGPRPRFSITLTRDEIVEDIYSVTGSLPRRRPRKRPRVVQKQLDALFPGSWLSEITPETYRVPN